MEVKTRDLVLEEGDLQNSRAAMKEMPDVFLLDPTGPFCIFGEHAHISKRDLKRNAIGTDEAKIGTPMASARAYRLRGQAVKRPKTILLHNTWSGIRRK